MLKILTHFPACVKPFSSSEFTSRCIQMFGFVWSRADHDTRRALTRLAGTWRPLLPAPTLALVDATMGAAVATALQPPVAAMQPAPQTLSYPTSWAAPTDPRMGPPQFITGVGPIPQEAPHQLQQPASPPPAAFGLGGGSSATTTLDFMASLQSLTGHLVGAPPPPTRGAPAAGSASGAGGQAASTSGAAQSSTGRRQKFGKVYGSLTFHPPSILKVRGRLYIASCSLRVRDMCTCMSVWPSMLSPWIHHDCLNLPCT